MKFNKVSSFDVSDFRGGGGGSEIAGARDRTLLQKLGFVDRDKGNPKHDLACLYLAENIAPLGDGVARRYGEGLPKKGEWGTSLERHVTKGDGKYKTTVGFIDVVAVWNYRQQERNTYSGETREYWESTCEFGIEVKIEPVSPGDLLRQIAVYSEYSTVQRWVAAVNFAPTDAFVQAVEARGGIAIVRLGAKFERWAAAQRNKKATGVPEV